MNEMLHHANKSYAQSGVDMSGACTPNPDTWHLREPDRSLDCDRSRAFPT